MVTLLVLGPLVLLMSLVVVLWLTTIFFSAVMSASWRSQILVALVVSLYALSVVSVAVVSYRLYVDQGNSVDFEAGVKTIRFRGHGYMLGEMSGGLGLFRGIADSGYMSIMAIEPEWHRTNDAVAVVSLKGEPILVDLVQNKHEVFDSFATAPQRFREVWNQGILIERFLYWSAVTLALALLPLIATCRWALRPAGEQLVEEAPK